MASKPIWESKVLWVNLLSGVVMALTATEVLAVLPVTTLPYVAAGVAVLNIILRFVTDKAVHV